MKALKAVAGFAKKFFLVVKNDPNKYWVMLGALAFGSAIWFLSMVIVDAGNSFQGFKKFFAYFGMWFMFFIVLNNFPFNRIWTNRIDLVCIAIFSFLTSIRPMIEIQGSFAKFVLYLCFLIVFIPTAILYVINMMAKDTSEAKGG